MTLPSAKRTVLLLAVWLLLAPALSSVRVVQGDVLYLKGGKIIPGEIVKDGSTRISFKGLDGRVKRYDKAKVERIEVTWMAPDLARSDPQWSGVMVDERIKRDMPHIKEKPDVIRTKHYIIFTNSPAGKKYVATMEDVYRRFKKEFPFEENESDLLLPVFLFLTNDQYYQFCNKTLGMTLAEARSTDGVASRDFYACFYRSPKDSIHYHEGAHQIVKNRLRAPGGGSWFQEGLAVYFEMVVFPQERKLELVRAMIKSERFTPLRELMELRSLIFSSDPTKSSAIAGERYDQSGSVVHFMKRGPHKDKFDDLMAAIKPLGFRSANWPELIHRIYGLSIAEFEKEWMDYIVRLQT